MTARINSSSWIPFNRWSVTDWQFQSSVTDDHALLLICLGHSRTCIHGNEIMEMIPLPLVEWKHFHYLLFVLFIHFLPTYVSGPLKSITSSNRVESSLCHFQASRGCLPPLLTAKNSVLCFYLHCWLFFSFFFYYWKTFLSSSLNSVYKSQLHLSLYRRVNV